MRRRELLATLASALAPGASACAESDLTPSPSPGEELDDVPPWAGSGRSYNPRPRTAEDPTPSEYLRFTVEYDGGTQDVEYSVHDISALSIAFDVTVRYADREPFHAVEATTATLPAEPEYDRLVRMDPHPLAEVYAPAGDVSRFEVSASVPTFETADGDEPEVQPHVDPFVIEQIDALADGEYRSVWFRPAIWDRGSSHELFLNPGSGRGEVSTEDGDDGSGGGGSVRIVTGASDDEP